VHQSKVLEKSQPFFMRVTKTDPRKSKLLVRCYYKTNISHKHRSATLGSVLHIPEWISVHTLMCGQKTPYYTFISAKLTVFKNWNADK
jgi:hypothetical protein